MIMSAMLDGQGRNMEVVGQKLKGELPHPPIQGLKQGSVGETMSDMQAMQQNERKQHEDNYKYEFGHNDHGMGQ